MNKKLFLGVFAAAGILLATSCQNDELDAVQTGNEATVSFTLGVEGGVQTRAISDGLTANRLVYAVFDEEGNRITTIAKVDKDANFPTTENITLAKGQTYKVAFWAQNSATSAYVLDDDMNLTIDYTNSANNDEKRDAFFKTETFTVTGNAQIDVVLKRPFAQINLGVTDTDWDAAVASGIEIATSKVVIKNAFTNMDLIDGSVSGETEVVYDFGATPKSSNEVLKVDLDEDGTAEEYHYLSMSYILVDAQKSTLQDLDFTFHPISGNDIVFGEGLNNVPVQRNWRTNIIGQILTGNIDFNISIDPIYDGEYNNGEAQPVNINGVYYATIQEAVNHVEDGDVIKVATGTYNEVVNVAVRKNFTLEAAGPNVVVTALNHQANENSVVKVKGITFDNSLTATGWFIGTAPNIAPCVGAWGGNLTFEDCAFIVAGDSGKETGVMTWYTTENNVMSLSFNNCTFEGKDGHASARAMQIYGHVNMEVTNCTFNTKKDYTLKYVAENGNVAKFSNNTVNNSENFVELGSSVYPGTNYTANIYNNTLGNGVNTHVIANNENQTVNVDGNVSVIAEGVVKDANGNYIASSNEGITNAITDGATTINLTKGSYVIPSAAKGKNLTFAGTGNAANTIIECKNDGYDKLNGSTVTFENLTIETDNETYRGFIHVSGATYKNCIIKNQLTLYSNGNPLLFDNCTFLASGNNYNVWTWGTSATFKDCTFNCDGKAMLVYGSGTSEVTFTNCIFNDFGGQNGKSAIETGNDYDATYTININNCKVNGFDVNSVSGSNVWGNKNSMAADKLNVIIDNVDVY